jgi:hypothetical protein
MVPVGSAVAVGERQIEEGEGMPIGSIQFSYYKSSTSMQGFGSTTPRIWKHNTKLDLISLKIWLERGPRRRGDRTPTMRPGGVLC